MGPRCSNGLTQKLKETGFNFIMTQQTKNPIDKLHREALKKVGELQHEAFSVAMQEGKSPTEAFDAAHEAQVQYLADTFPQLPLTEEEERAIAQLESEMEITKKSSVVSPTRKHFYSLVQSALQRLRQQGDRKAWLEKVADVVQGIVSAKELHNREEDVFDEGFIKSLITSAGEGVE